MEDKELNNILEDEDISYIQDEEVIDDSLCPKCMNKVSENAEFCSCGFYVQAAKRSSVFSFVFFVIIFVVITGLLLINTGILPSLGIKVGSKITKKQMGSSTSPVIRVKGQLKNWGLNEQIRDVYQKDYKNPNVLIVVIQPDHWPAMKEKRKDYILKTISNFWKEAYKGDNPEVIFGNSHK